MILGCVNHVAQTFITYKTRNLTVESLANIKGVEVQFLPSLVIDW